MHAESPIFEHKAREGKTASVSIDTAVRSPHPVTPLLMGKFCEHLGSNIYNGMDAQILRNPTFAKWRFGVGDGHIDGGVASVHDPKVIEEQVRGGAKRLDLTDSAATQLLEDYRDGAAFGWVRLGAKDDVPLSPDAGPHGGRCQRFETPRAPAAAPQGLAQWTRLPLHRTRGYVFRIVARAAEATEIELALAPAGNDGTAGAALCAAKLRLTREWSTQTGELNIPASAKIDEQGLYRFAVTCAKPANVVLARVLLYPNDHIDYADPDVIRLLRKAKLPLLRWPGGNFVSGYRWRDGIGPVDARPTLPNPAWGGLEYNLFGTHEFIAFCRAVGCEPMICVNAGDGTPAEASAWVEYCNGGANTPLGRLRTDHGHAEPFRIRYWEIGNEISGRHQIGWTTPGGNADRYLCFTEAMRKADASILFLGCGGPWGPDHPWNARLVEDTRGTLRCVTDHILVGGTVTYETDPAELFHTFMSYAAQLGKQYRAQRQRMEAAGVKNPRLALTEMQLFARFRGEVKPDKPLNPDTTPMPSSISEAIYYATILFECVRMGDFVEMITHSATVNHGGGLRKTRERAWANPIHYAHQMCAALAGGTPVKVKLECGTYATQNKYSLIQPASGIPVLDALAVQAADGSLVLMVAHRGAQCGPLDVTLDLGGFKNAGAAEVLTLAGETMYAANTAAEPEKIVPRASPLASGAKLSLRPFSLTRVTWSS